MKKFFTLAATALFIMTSCSGDDAAPVDNPDPGPTTPTQVRMQVKEMEVTPAGGATTVTKFEYDGRKLIKIIYGVNDFEEFYYGNHGVTYMKRTINGQISITLTFSILKEAEWKNESATYMKTITQHLLHILQL